MIQWKFLNWIHLVNTNLLGYMNRYQYRLDYYIFSEAVEQILEVIYCILVMLLQVSFFCILHPPVCIPLGIPRCLGGLRCIYAGSDIITLGCANQDITAFGVATVAYSIDTKATWIVTRYVDIRSVILCRQRLKQYVRWRQCQTEYKRHQMWR